MFIGAGCKKNKTKTELEKLPAITQSGANTFGCLINGKAWAPNGFHIQPNFFVIVDPGYKDGNVDIRAYRIGDGIREDISLGSDSIKSAGTFKISDYSRAGFYFSKSTANLSKDFCEIFNGGIFRRNGFIKIVKYDLINGIISGEFEIQMINKDCGYGDTIKITNGRFDYKL